jgi:membrane protein required for colicin V production
VTLLDFLILVILGLSVGSGIASGFIRVGIGFLAVICGVVFGFWNYGLAAEWVHKYVKSPAASNLLGFFLIFTAILLLGALISKIIARIFKWIGLSWLDRLLGGLFGLVRGSLVVVAFVAVLMAFVPKPLPNWMVNSQALPYAIDASHQLTEFAPVGIKNAFRESMLEIRQVWQDQLQSARKKLLPGVMEPDKSKGDDKSQDKSQDKAHEDPPKREAKKKGKA